MPGQLNYSALKNINKINKLQPSNSSFLYLGSVPLQDKQNSVKRLRNNFLRGIFHLPEVTSSFLDWNPLPQCFDLDVGKHHTVTRPFLSSLPPRNRPIYMSL